MAPASEDVVVSSSTSRQQPASLQQQQQLFPHRRLPTPTTAAAAAVGMVALAVLVRRGRVSKARLVELAAAILGGLLSSSCCTLQLVLNSFSLGCAGRRRPGGLRMLYMCGLILTSRFDQHQAGFAVLDKARPLFLALTFTSLAYKTWRYDIRLHRAPFRSLPTWFIAAALAGSPALVRAANRRRGLAAAVEAEKAQVVPIQFKVTGMKCEACGSGLRNALEATSPGVRADVLFDEGVVYVEQEGGTGELELEAAVRTVFEHRGYTAERVPTRTTAVADVKAGSTME